MPRKRRDYKAEYAARKTHAQRAGYTGVSEYSRARKGMPRNVQPLPKAAKLYAESSERRQAYAWSRAHSHVDRSKYTASMSDAQVRAYLKAYDPRSGTRWRSKAKRLKDLKPYLFEYWDVDEREWEEMYEEK